MLKRKINKATFDALSDEMKKLYVAEGDDFIINLDGGEELSRANARLQTELTTMRTELTTVKNKLEAIDNTSAHKAGDVVAIEASWKGKFDTMVADKDKIIKKKDEFIQKVLVSEKATKLAGEISSDPEILLPHLIGRLQAEFNGDADPITRVLDKDGKPSALSLEDLGKEFIDNPKFKSIIVVSKASGGGASGGNGNRPGGAGSGSKKFAELGDAERTALFKSDPAEFTRQSEEHKASLRKM